MKKILLLINSLKLGGAERVVQTLTNELCNTYEVHLLTLEKNNYFTVSNKVKVVSLSQNSVNNKKIYKISSIIVNALRLKQYVKDNNIKIVQSHLFRSNYVNILSKMFFSPHVVQVVNHSLPNRLYNEGFSGKINIFLIKYLYKYSDMNISVSNKVEQELNCITKLPYQKFVIYNPFDLNLIQKKMKEPILDFNFNITNRYLISIGRINSIKRYDILIKALNEINDNKLHLLILGKEEDTKIVDILNKSNNKSNIHFLGHKENPYKYLYNCNALVLSSESESFGNIIIESMICSTVIISTDCGGPRELLSPLNLKCTNRINIAEYGILTPVNDFHKLAEAIKIMLDDGILRKKYLLKFKKRVKLFSLYSIIKKYKSTFMLN